MDEREVMGRQEFQIPEWLKRIQQLHFEQPDGIPLLVLYPTSKQHQEESRRLHQVLQQSSVARKRSNGQWLSTDGFMR